MSKGTSASRGCSSLAGTAQIPGYQSAMGKQAQQSNRLYKLAVMKQSLINKKRIFEEKIRGVDTLLKLVDADLKNVQRLYFEEAGREGGCTGKEKKILEDAPHSKTRRMELKY